MIDDRECLLGRPSDLDARTQRFEQIGEQEGILVHVVDQKHVASERSCLGFGQCDEVRLVQGALFDASARAAPGALLSTRGMRGVRTIDSPPPYASCSCKEI